MIDEREHENPPLDEKRKESSTARRLQAGKPFYEEEFDPYFAEQLEAPALRRMQTAFRTRTTGTGGNLTTTGSSKACGLG